MENRNRKIVALLLVLIMVAALAACGRDTYTPALSGTPPEIQTTTGPETNDEDTEIQTTAEPETDGEDIDAGDTPFAGLWESEYEDYLFLFRADGTGSFVEVEPTVRNSDYQTIEWSVNDGMLTIEFDGDYGFRTFVGVYEFEAGRLLLSNGGNESFERIEVGDILGTWSDDRWYTYTFNADGTGTGIMLDEDITLEFEWASNNNGVLTLSFDGINGEIEYTVLGNIIRMRAVGDRHTYILERIR